MSSSLQLLNGLISSFTDMTQTLCSMRRKLYQFGFDIFHEFPIQPYNQKIVGSSNKILALNEFGKKQTHSILIGNTKHLWPIFIEELTSNPNEWQNESDPLNKYTLLCLQSVCNEYLKQNGIEYTLRFTFELEKDKLIAFQRLCDVANCAHLDSDSFLCIHPKYGPWIALRALIVLNKEYKEDSHQIIESLDDICTQTERENVQNEWRKLQNVLFEHKEPQTMESWRYWLKLRDSYSIGKEYRYSEEQILYHYTLGRECSPMSLTQMN